MHAENRTLGENGRGESGESRGESGKSRGESGAGYLYTRKPRQESRARDIIYIYVCVCVYYDNRRMRYRLTPQPEYVPYTLNPKP